MVIIYVSKLKALSTLALMYEFVFSCSIIGVSAVAPHLIPQESYNCFGQVVTFTCTITRGTTIRWEVDVVDVSISDIQKAFLDSDQPGETVNVTNNRNHVFTFMLKSRFPIVSTITTEIVHDLQGASISCEDLSTNEVDISLIHIINESSLDSGTTSSLVYEQPMENDVFISVEWHPHFNKTPVVIQSFLVSINPPIEMGSNFNTTSTSIQLIVLYNQDYHILVTANNCARNRSRVFVDMVFNIAKCSPPALNRYMLANYSNHTIEGSMISFYCTEGFIPNNTITSICTDQGKWSPDPLKHHCEPSDYQGSKSNNGHGSCCFLSLIVTGWVCSIMMLMIGLVCGIITTRIFYKNRKYSTGGSPNTSPAQRDILYENVQIEVSQHNITDLHLNENQAYECIPNNI